MTDYKLIVIRDKDGRIMVRATSEYIRFAGRVNESYASARIYPTTLYMDRPRTRNEWRTWMAARHALRAEIAFYEIFA